MSVDLAAERAASLARTEARQSHEMLDARASMLRWEQGEGSLEEKAANRWPHFDAEERAAIVDRAHQQLQEVRHVSATEAGILTTREVREITIAFLGEYPGATSQEAWNHVAAQGTPSMKESSFKAATMPKLRKELGIGRPISGRKAPAVGWKAAKAIERIKEANHATAVFTISAELHGADLRQSDATAVKEAAARRVAELNGQKGGVAPEAPVATAEATTEGPAEDAPAEEPAAPDIVSPSVAIELGEEWLQAQQRADGTWWLELGARVDGVVVREFIERFSAKFLEVANGWRS